MPFKNIEDLTWSEKERVQTMAKSLEPQIKEMIKQGAGASDSQKSKREFDLALKEFNDDIQGIVNSPQRVNLDLDLLTSVLHGTIMQIEAYQLLKRNGSLGKEIQQKSQH